MRQRENIFPLYTQVLGGFMDIGTFILILVISMFTVTMFFSSSLSLLMRFLVGSPIGMERVVKTIVFLSASVSLIAVLLTIN